MSQKRFNVVEAIDFVTSGDVSELSDLSDEEEFEKEESQILINVAIDESEDIECFIDEDETPLAQLVGENHSAKLVDTEEKGGNSKDKASDTKPARVYRWRKKDTIEFDVTFSNQFTDPPLVLPTPYHYFRMFFPSNLDDLVAEQTNLYSVQRSGRNIKTSAAEISALMGIMIRMGIVQLPSYRLYWSQLLRYDAIAEVMPRNRFIELMGNLHFVNNLKIDGKDKLAKIRPVINVVRDRCVKIEPEEYHSVDEQIIPSKTKYSLIRQYNPKKPTKWGFKNFVRAGSSGLMYDFYIYEGKSTEMAKDTPYNHLAKSAQVVAKLSIHLPEHQHHKLFFDNWFTTLELMFYLKNKGIHAVGTVRHNRVSGCPLLPNKDLEKKERGAMDYRVDNNTGLIVVKWVDNKIVELTSNFVGINPTTTVKRWCKKEKKRINVSCPQIVNQYNKSMGGVDLADMLIALYRIPIRTKRWYLKIFWHLVDIAKVNAWILYKRHYEQTKLMLPNQSNNFKKLLEFSNDISYALIGADKVAPTSSRGRPPKRRSTDPILRGKASAVALPVHDIRYDQVGHWPEAVTKKNRCRNCDMTCRMKCSKCKIYLCVLPDRNCFVDFHSA